MSRLCLIALALLAVLAPEASAAPPWSDPETVSSASLFVEEPNVVFAGDGNALATWRWSGPRPKRGTAPGGTRLALRDPRALLFGPEHTAPNFVTPLVSSDLVRVLGLDLLRRGSGRASLRARFGDSRSTFEPPRTITTYTPAGGPPSLDAPNGTLAAWIAKGSHGRRIVRAALRVGERFGDPFTLRGRGRANDVVAGSSDGVMFVAWERAGLVEARVRLSSRGGWGSVQRLGSAAKASTSLRATGSGRRGYLAWLAEGSDSATLRAAALPVARTRFNPTQTVDRIDHAPPAEEHSPELVSVPERRALVAWTDWDGARWRVRAAAAEQSIRFGPQLDVSPPGESAVLGDAASVPQGTTLPPYGTTLVVWSPLDSAGQVGDGVRAALRPLGGVFGPPEDVSDLNRARLPAVAVDFPVGRWTVIWSQRIGPDQPGVPLERITTFARSATRGG